jgi:hypothetical protein
MNEVVVVIFFGLLTKGGKGRNFLTHASAIYPSSKVYFARRAKYGASL